MGIGVQAHHPPVDRHRCCAPVDYRVGFGQQAGHAEPSCPLGTHPQPGQPFGFRARSGGLDARQGLDQQLGAELGQPLPQLAGILQRANGQGALQ